MSNQRCDEKVPEKTGKRRSGSTARKIILVIIVAGAFTGLGIGIFFWVLSAKLLDSKPVEFKAELPDMKATAAVQRKIMPIYQEMFRSKPEDPYKFTLTAEEINVLLANLQMLGKTFASGGINSSQFKWPAGLNVKYDGKSFWCEYSFELPFPTPFGKYLNLYSRVVPGMKSGDIKFLCEDFKAGDLEISTDLVNRMLSEAVNEKRNEIIPLTKIVSDFYIDEQGLLHVTVYPYALRVFVMESMRKRMEKGAKQQKSGDKGAK